MKMGSSQIDLQLQWDKYFEEARVIEYESLKKAASEINDYFHKNFWSWLDLKEIVLIFLLYNKAHLPDPYKNIDFNQPLFETIQPKWQVALMASAYNEISQNPFTDDMMYSIQDFFKGRFNIIKTNSYYIELASKLKSSSNLEGLLVLETHPKINLKILLISTSSDSKNENISQAFYELSSLEVKFADLSENGFTPFPLEFENESQTHIQSNDFSNYINSLITKENNNNELDIQ